MPTANAVLLAFKLVVSVWFPVLIVKDVVELSPAYPIPICGLDTIVKIADGATGVTGDVPAGNGARLT